VKIGILLKQVPDTETKIKIKGDASNIETADIKYIVNPYDEFAIEAAVKTKEANAGSEVVVFAVGPAGVQMHMRTAMAMGADRGVHVDDPALGTSDSLGAARALAAAVKAEGIELLFAGARAIDDDMQSVGPMVGELLGWAAVQVAGGVELSADKKSVTVKRKVGGGAIEVVEATLPAIVGCDWKMNEPRFASLPGIMKAKSKPLAVKKLADLGVNAGDVAAKVSLGGFSLPAERGAVKIIKGDSPEAIAHALVQALRNEAKVI
jgi:electron transfer flavoprotein beta subunit